MKKNVTRYHKAQSDQRVKFVYFDVGGVLLDTSGSIEGMAKILNAPTQEVREFWWGFDDALNRKTMTAEEFWVRIKRHFHYPGPDVDVVDFWTERNRPILETHTFARKISRTHKVGILSNAMPRVIAKERKLGHIPPLRFEVIIESHAVGFAKPDPRIYALAHKHAGVEAGEILFIDDREINLPEAQKTGFHTYLFDTENPAGSVAELEKLLIE